MSQGRRPSLNGGCNTAYSMFRFSSFGPPVHFLQALLRYIDKHIYRSAGQLDAKCGVAKPKIGSVQCRHCIRNALKRNKDELDTRFVLKRVLVSNDASSVYVLTYTDLHKRNGDQLYKTIVQLILVLETFAFGSFAPDTSASRAFAFESVASLELPHPVY